MVAAISLEALTQDNEILGTHNEVTTRRKLLPTLLNDNESKVSELYARSIGQDVFVDLMNQKAVSLGLSNTHFNDVTSPVVTTYEDYMRFMTYISTYKSYIRTIQNVDSGK
jgi:D-alanyl-D-alanine carboxypeptidase